MNEIDDRAGMLEQEPVADPLASQEPKQFELFGPAQLSQELPTLRELIEPL